MALDVGEARHLVGDEGGLVALVLGLVPREQLTGDLLGPQVLRLARRVVGDHGVRGVEDALGRAVVLIHDDDGGLGEHLFEAHEVAVVRSAEAIDALILVSHCRDVAVALTEHAHHLPLREVRVLELVDEQVAEPVPPPGERIGVLAEQLHDETEQVVEVDRRRVEQALLVLGVDLGDPVLRR